VQVPTIALWYFGQKPKNKTSRPEKAQLEKARRRLHLAIAQRSLWRASLPARTSPTHRLAVNTPPRCTAAHSIVCTCGATNALCGVKSNYQLFSGLPITILPAQFPGTAFLFSCRAHWQCV